jgi:malonyl-CoA/methylmalonyl-CoA synthetase
VTSDLYSRFAAAAAREPGATALAAHGEVWTYGLLLAAARRLSLGLARRGLGRGDRVAFLAPSSADFAVAWLATLRCGAAMVPIHLAYRRREVAHVIADAEPKLVVAGRAEGSVLDELDAAERRSIAAVVPIEELAAWEDEEPAESDSLAPLVALDAGDLALLLYTSGTTGASKGAMLSHGNVAAMIDALHEAWAWSAADRLLLALPLFHLHGLVVGLHCALAAGATVLLEPRFDASRVVDRLARGEATLFFGVPTMYVRLVEELERRRADERPVDLAAVRLFVSGSAPLAPETFAAFRRLAGQAILERYGMTETGMIAGNPLAGPRLAGTVGRALPGVELRVADTSGAAAPDGAEGEVEVRGPAVFAGYWRSPQKTAESFREAADGRWFRTGDAGRIDPASGHLTLLGRRSELILSGGFNVYPREVEEVLLAYPGVRDAAVVGEPHPEWGESPVAFLVAGRDVAETGLAAHCRAELAPFKLPRRFVFVEALPRNAMGKVEKRKLAEAAGRDAGRRSPSG